MRERVAGAVEVVSYAVLGAALAANVVFAVLAITAGDRSMAGISLGGACLAAAAFAWCRFCYAAIDVGRRADQAGDDELDALLAYALAVPGVYRGRVLPKGLRAHAAQLVGDAVINYVHQHYERRDVAPQPDPG